MALLGLDWLFYKQSEVTLNSPLLRQFSKFSLIGFLTNFIGYSLYLFLIAIQVEPKLVVSLLYPFGSAMSYYLNSRITFNSSAGFSSTGLPYLVVYFLGYLLNLLIIILFVDCLGCPPQLVQLFAMFAVALVSFLILKMIVFVSR